MNRLERWFLRRSRVLWRGYRTVRDRVRHGATAALADRLARIPDPRVGSLAAAIAMLAGGGTSQDRAWIERIEDLRLGMLDSSAPLVDGSLGEPGVYDDSGTTLAAACSVSKPPRAAFFLYCLARAFDSRRILELGTNVGISSAYLAAAGAEGAGARELVTLESSRYRQRAARQLHESLGLNGISYVHGLFVDTLPGVLDSMQPDLAFIDGHHQFQPTLDYTDQVIAHCAPGCVFVFDDIDWSEGMRKAWQQLRRDPRLGIAVDLRSVGVCVLTGPGAERITSDPVRIF